MKSMIYNIVKSAIFLAILLVAIVICTRISIPDGTLKRQNELYDNQEKDSIDIAFVGSSSTYRFYDIMEIWDTYQLTSMCYYGSALPFDFVIPMLEMIQEEQSPQLYVIDLRNVVTDEFNLKYYGAYETSAQQDAFVNALNIIPDSINRWSTILESDYLSGEGYMHLSGLIYNHEGFTDGVIELLTNDNITEPLAYKGNSLLVYQVRNMNGAYVDFDQIEEQEYTLTDETIERLTEIFDYCNEHDLNVYFTFSPYVNARNVADQDIRRELGELITENGFPFTDFKSQINEIGLDVTADYYDAKHVNAVGANKYTLYAMECFLGTYDIEGEYGESVINSWNASYAEWTIYNEESLAEMYAE